MVQGTAAGVGAGGSAGYASPSVAETATVKRVRRVIPIVSGRNLGMYLGLRGRIIWFSASK